MSPFPIVRLRAAANAVSLTIGGNEMPLSGDGSHDISAAEVLDATLRRILASAGQSVRDIKSAEIGQLSNSASQMLHRLLVTERTMRERHEREIFAARTQAVEAYAAFAEWNQGFFWKRIRPGRFRELGSALESANRHLELLTEEQNNAVLTTEVDAAPEISASFDQLCTAFQTLARSEKIWDTLSEQRTNQVAERTAATHTVVRRPVTFSVSSSGFVFRDWRVPRLANANGGDLYFYPGCLLYSKSNEAFALIDARDVTLTIHPQRFHESEALPKDAKRVGTTWLKVNKDGTPDRRFARNRPIPILEYAELTLTTPSGIHEEYLISNSTTAAAFAAAWAAYQRAFLA